MSENVIRMLEEAFGRVHVEFETPPAGQFEHLAAALDRATLTGAVNRWTATRPELELLAYLDHATELGAVEVLERAPTTGHAWAPCDRCGEITLLPHGTHGVTTTGRRSGARVDPQACRFSWHRTGDGTVVHCPGKHRADGDGATPSQ